MTFVPAISLWQLFLIFLKLGCSSFGGPVAHIAFFRHEFVQQRRWFTEQEYCELVALCQFLPGPASSQVGMGIGLTVAGFRGALVSWLGFTLPSALLMTGFGYSYLLFGSDVQPAWLNALKLVTVAVVAQASWLMARALCPDRTRACIAICSAVLLLLYSGALAQISVIVLAALAGMVLLSEKATAHAGPLPKRVGNKSLSIFFC
jgi:chromate transporter